VTPLALHLGMSKFQERTRRATPFAVDGLARSSPFYEQTVMDRPIVQEVIFMNFRRSVATLCAVSHIIKLLILVALIEINGLIFGGHYFTNLKQPVDKSSGI
jgi:hypothetical protein